MVNGAIVGDGEDGVSVPVVEAPSESVGDADIYPTCETCGDINYEWTPGTRGRRPRYHAECKPVSPSRSGGTTPRRSRGLRNEAALRDALLQRYYQLGDLASLMHPAYGMGIKQQAEAAVEADIEYARVNPTFRRYLETGLEKTALGAVIAIHAAMLKPMATGIVAQQRRKAASKPPKRPASSTSRPTPSGPIVDGETTPDMGGATVYDFGTPDAEGDNSLDKPSNAAAMPGMPG
jgi:hypothetical protein